MATRQQFADEMKKMYDNHGMYVGTGNGERTLDVAGKFFEMEKNYGRRDSNGNPLWYSDTARDYEFLAKCYRKKWDMSKSRAADCSGAETHCLRVLGIIPEAADYNCRTFIKKCKLIPLKDLIPGDLVFNKEVDPTHMATYVGDADGESNMVVEFKGRDDGCVCRKVSAGGWAVGGRLPDKWFDDNFLILTRELYYREGNLMKGDDVKEVQDQLRLTGYNCGASDGVYGKKTKTAVQAFQIEHDLTADGIVGEKTAKALGFIWEG